MNPDLLLGRLEGVRRCSDHSWLAKCPAHQDRSASLSIAVKDERLLIHDFAGCGVVDVLGAIGLTLSDLYPERERRDFKRLSPWERKLSVRESGWRAALDAFDHNARIVEIAAKIMATGGVLKVSERAELLRACGVIHDCFDTLCGPRIVARRAA